MTTTILPTRTPEAPEVVPRTLSGGVSGPDQTFRTLMRAAGWLVMILTGSIGLFLGYKLLPTIHRYGFGYFTRTDFNPERNVVGIASALVGTAEVALVALVVAFPLAVLAALYISEYAPPWSKSWLISLIDLMAAIPSIVYGVWGEFFLMPHLVFIGRWLAEWFGWLPIFKVTGADPHAAGFPKVGGYRFEQSAFDAGLVVALMVIPLACSVMRNVFAQAPLGEREGAYALGATRWGMIRAVVLPFGRGGVIGATMLGLGRALGETVAVLLIISLVFDVKVRILESGTVTISALIADRFGEATSSQLAALLAAGFVLFMLTLLVNTLAAVVVNRSRSGAGVEL
jgi:phosphate transport system permease protein